MTSTIIEALSGLGMFLFGMLYMEHALKEAAGIRFKSWIKNSTSTSFKALLTGAGATALLQSSSVVTLMTLSFVSASLISLESGIALIFGSNVGTTATAWIVATLGFKVKIEAFALPMIGGGGLLMVFSSESKKLTSVAKVSIGFGLLFFGLDIMKNAIESVAQNIELSQFASYPLIAFVAIGFVLTALIQSSSAATAIVLSALFSNILGFEQAAAMVVGTNVGTTITAILGAIGGIPDKKRAAAAHFLFNVITAAVAFMLIPWLAHLLLETFGLASDPTMALALFHTIFNLLGVILLLPFTGVLARFLQERFKAKVVVPTRYLQNVDPRVPDSAFVALRDEVSNLFVKTLKYALLVANIKPRDLLIKKLDPSQIILENQTIIDFDYKRSYDVLKEVEFEIVEFVAILTQQHLDEEQGRSLETLLAATRESVYAAKILKDVKKNIDSFAQSDHSKIIELYDTIRKNLVYTLRIFVSYMQEEWDQEKCMGKFEKAVNENLKILKEATLSIGIGGMNEHSAVSLLHINRSIHIASNSLLEASRAVRMQFSIDDEKI